MALRPYVASNGSKIFDYYAMRSFTPRVNGGEPAFSFRYRIAHCYTLSAIKWTENTQINFFAAHHLQRWADRKDSLWWSALSHITLGKRTVRSHCARRLRQAFAVSLKKEGYAPDGSRLLGTKEKPPLYGTAMFGAVQPILNIKNDALVEQMDDVVALLLSQQPWNPQPPKRNNKYKAEGGFQRGLVGGRTKQQDPRPRWSNKRSIKK
ncbi:hypothetical protein EG329_006753 [Mollisiaceae sp. DMI_Dod_QoI]|nr:hypothetical protein EG329_006753 [Helotiales sp. DMI_Dod_QoI]